jgi:RNA 2',3'-cyclic 3'-phosphodiesterase
VRAGSTPLAGVRAFVALVLAEPLRVRLGEEVARLRSGRPGVAWVAPENLHLTLKFLGEVDPPRLESLQAALAAAVGGRSRFQLTCAGLGAFPTTSRPRVIWAGVHDGAEASTRLAEAVEHALAPLGFDPKGRAFSAHITLGRVRVPRGDPALTTALEVARARIFGATPIDRVVLMRSDLSPRGARYTELTAFPLA